jgi:hypothetical protein
MTRSEQNTVKFFAMLGVELAPIATSATETPDYAATISGTEVVIEVKELTENEEEKRVLRRIESNEVFSYDSQSASKRLSGKITKANSQLKRLCGGSKPGLLIIQDTRSFFTTSVMPFEEIKQAMFGQREIWRTVPTFQGTNELRTVADLFGKGKSTTQTKNTHVSAVCLLQENYSRGSFKLEMLHNPFARYPFPHGLLPREHVCECVIQSVHEYCQHVWL